MSDEMESLLNQLAYYQSSLAWLRNWNDRIEEGYTKDIGNCESAIDDALCCIDELEQAIAIERIVQLCLTGE